MGEAAEPVATLLARLAKTVDRIDAEVLLADALGVPRLEMLSDPSRLVDPACVAGAIARRQAGEPVAYIVGRREFWSLDLAVTPDVLIPRPDSETLVAAAVDFFSKNKPPAMILDLGTGSGALLLAALSEFPQATGVGIDRAEPALAVARLNAAKLGLADRADFRLGDWSGTGAAFDLVLCNPPYVATGDVLPDDVADHEPHGALFAGADGLDAYRDLVPRLGRQLTDRGCACIEIGATQAAAVGALLAAAGLPHRTVADLAGRPRCLVVTR